MYSHKIVYSSFALGRFAYGKRFHAVHANTSDTARFDHTRGSNEWNADFAIFSIRKMAAQAPPDVT